MRLQAYTREELFTLGVAIVRSVTGVEYPFSERTWHRAMVEVQSLFAASGNIETLRLVKGSNLEGLSGQLLDRRLLESGITKYPAQAARVAGRFVRSGPTGTAINISALTTIIRPATATQSEIAFRSEATGVIDASDSTSNLVYGTCTETGDRGNGITAGAQLSLRNPINGVAHFLTTSDSAGGYSRESDEDSRVRARAQRRGHGECTWAGLEYLLTKISLSSGQRIVTANVFEAFDEPSPLYTGIVYAIIDDGTGDSSLIAPIDSTTFGFGGPTWWQYNETGYNVYVRNPYYPFVLWDDGVNATLQRKIATVWTTQTLGTDYFVDNDSGHLAFVSPLQTGAQIRAQFSFYGGLAREAARYVNGVYKSTTIKGWRPVGYPVRIRPAYTVIKPTVSAGLEFYSGWDSTFGRSFATTNVLAYLNGLDIGESARYDVVQGVIHKTPGVKTVSDLQLDGGIVDIPPSHKFGVVRGNAAYISL